MSIAFDVLVEASIVVQEYDRHNDSDDRCYQWFRLCCEGDLKLGVSSFKVLEVDVYDKKKNYSHKRFLSDQLVPILTLSQVYSVTLIISLASWLIFGMILLIGLGNYM